MIVRTNVHVKNANFYLLNVTSRSLATQVAAKLDPAQSIGTQSEYQKAAPFSSIPGPSAAQFILGNLIGGKLYGTDFKKMMAICRKEYGDLMKIPGVFGRPSMVMTHNPDHFQIIFRTEGVWPVRSGLDSIQYYREKIRPDLFSKYQGLANAQGQQWGEFRTAVNPVMIQPKTAKRYVPIVDQVACEFLERIRHIRDPSTNQLPENFEEEINKWTLESIGVIAMDTKLGLLTGKFDARAAEFMKSVKDFFILLTEVEFKPSLWRIFPTPTFNKFMKTLDTMTNIANEYIMEAKAKLQSKSGDSANESEESVLEKLLKIEDDIATIMAMDMVSAGVDTTSSAFIATLYLLAKNPEKQANLRNELMSILPEKDSKFTVDTMRHLPYLRACIKEAQRLLPTVNGNSRNAGQDLVLDGYQIPKGTPIMMGSAVLAVDEKQFPEAKKFLPERWLKQETPEGKCPASAKSAHPFIYLPFGFGPRMCIGRRFAEMESEIMIAKLIRNFDVTWEHEDLKFKTAAINLPDGKLMFTLNDVAK